MTAPRATRTAVQTRSVATRQRLLDAGAELLKERGYEGFTLVDVAAAADVSVGSIYQRIGNRDDLLLALYEREMERITEKTAILLDLQAMSRLPLEGAIHESVAAVATLFRRHAAFLRVAIAQSAANPELRRRGSQNTRALGDAFKSALLAHRASFRHSDPATAVDVCFRLTFSTLARRTTHGPSFDSPYRLSEAALVENLTAACLGVLMRS